jgi:hypothetical protein
LRPQATTFKMISNTKIIRIPISIQLSFESFSSSSS